MTPARRLRPCAREIFRFVFFHAPSYPPRVPGSHVCNHTMCCRVGSRENSIFSSETVSYPLFRNLVLELRNSSTNLLVTLWMGIIQADAMGPFFTTAQRQREVLREVFRGVATQHREVLKVCDGRCFEVLKLCFEGVSRCWNIQMEVFQGVISS